MRLQMRQSAPFFYLFYCPPLCGATSVSRTQVVDGINFLFIKKSGLYFVTTTKFNVSPSFVLELLDRLAKVFKVRNWLDCPKKLPTRLALSIRRLLAIRAPATACTFVCLLGRRRVVLILPPASKAPLPTSLSNSPFARRIKKNRTRAGLLWRAVGGVDPEKLYPHIRAAR